MFRSKRNALAKRLWKLRVSSRGNRACDDGSSGQGGSGSAPDYADAGAEELEVKAVAQAMLKRLKEAQLESLAQAVESQGADDTGCVLVPQGDLRLGRRTAPPHVLCCQLWRWPDLRNDYQLKRLRCCQTATDPLYVCCNPYHWSRLYKPESPPPPYTRFPQEFLDREDEAPSEQNSTETGGTNHYGSFCSQFLAGSSSASSGHHGPPWCTVAYWELRTRVGRLFPVQKPWVNVFADLPHGEGLCLGALVKSQVTKQEAILRTREKIGMGVTVSREDNAVWVYNRSTVPLFVNSPTLDPPGVRQLTVFKVPPGYSIKIFDYAKSELYKSLERRYHNQQRNQEEANQEQSSENGPRLRHQVNGGECLYEGPFDPNAVRISFAKGWGPKYSRQFVTSCPCWLEVLLTPPPPR